MNAISEKPPKIDVIFFTLIKKLKNNNNNISY